MCVRWYQVVISIIPALVLLAPSAIIGAAHADLQSADPAAKTVLAQSPVQVHLAFFQKIDSAMSEGTVTNADAVLVSTGFFVDPPDPTKMRIALRHNLPDGMYTVHWQTLSLDDNESAQGEYPFTVATMPMIGTGAGNIAPVVPRTPSVTFDGPNTRGPPIITTPIGAPSPTDGPHTHIDDTRVPSVILWVALAAWVSVMVIAVVAVRQWRAR